MSLVGNRGDIGLATKTQLVSDKVHDVELNKKIGFVSQYQDVYIKKRLFRLAAESPENTEIICDYITAEQTEINIKESTKEGKIKCLVWLSSFHNHKSYRYMIKQDILNYLNGLRKPESIDPTHSWIGSYNIRQMIFLKFFRWLYNSDESDVRKRVTPPCDIPTKWHILNRTIHKQGIPPRIQEESRRGTLKVGLWAILLLD